MQLDVFTMMVGISTVVLVVGLQLGYFWAQDRKAAWLGWLAGGFVLGAAALALYTPRGRIPDVLSIGLANVLLIASFGVAWQAARSFERRPPKLWPVLALAGLWIGLCASPAFMDSLPARLLVLSSINTGLSCLIALELWRGRGETLPSRLPAIIVMLGQGACMLARIPLAAGSPFPIGDTPSATWVGLSGLAALALMTTFGVLMVSLTKERRELEQRKFALSDYLTGLPNRRALFERSEEARDPRNQPLALLMLDLDKFKSINDRYGHAVGDKVLTAFTELARSQLRRDDILYRIGGEEFCLFLPRTPLPDAIRIADRLRAAFESLRLELPEGIVACTVSIGIAAGAGASTELTSLLSLADSAVYEAKASGRNRVVVASSSRERGTSLAA